MLEIVSNLPPASIEEILLLSGSRVWEAKDGCYCVMHMNNMDNPLKENSNQGHCWMVYPNNTNLSAPINYGFGAVYETTGSSGVYQSGACQPIPFDTTGCYLTGLSQQTTLTLICKILLETAPEVNSDLVTLTQPSCAFDPIVLDLYATVVRELPPGVKVSENAAGDWWRGILTVVQSVAPFFGPVGALVGGVAGGIKMLLAIKLSLSLMVKNYLLKSDKVERKKKDKLLT